MASLVSPVGSSVVMAGACQVCGGALHVPGPVQVLLS